MTQQRRSIVRSRIVITSSHSHWYSNLTDEDDAFLIQLQIRMTTVLLLLLLLLWRICRVSLSFCVQNLCLRSNLIESPPQRKRERENERMREREREREERNLILISVSWIPSNRELGNLGTVHFSSSLHTYSKSFLCKRVVLSHYIFFSPSLSCKNDEDEDCRKSRVPLQVNLSTGVCCC